MIPESNNEKLQELSIIITDKVRSVGRFWWYGLLTGLFLAIPVYYAARGVFVDLAVSNHKFPAYIYQEQTKVPLTVSDEKIFKLGGNAYSGYFKIKNSANYDWGVPDQSYTVSFTTTAGTEVAKITKSTFVLPSSEKIVIIPRFNSDKEPTQINVVLGASQFVHSPNRVPPNFEVEKINRSSSSGQFIVSAELKNKTPFTVKQVGLSALLYDKDNKIVGANYTSINSVQYAENRSFQFAWPQDPGTNRVEIIPEANIFDVNIYDLAPGTSPFDSQVTQ